MLCPNEFRPADRRDHDVRGAGDLSQIARAGMHNGHRRINPFPHEKQRKRFADDHASPKHDDVRTSDFNSALD